ncbi:hypothetical protein MPER_13935, partial [Moniliophthora perniciosa FA553]
ARPDLIAYLRNHLASTTDTAGSGIEVRTSVPTADTPAFTAIQPDQVEGEIEHPPEELSDKILFIINNLAPSNFNAKLTEMKELFVDEYSRWFANYLVDQRIGRS